MCVQNPWETHVPRTRRISESFAAMKPEFMLRRAFVYSLATTCLIVLLVYTMQPQFSTKEYYTEGSQVTNAENLMLLHLEVSNDPYYMYSVWWN
jgi:hypothetical protein